MRLKHIHWHRPVVDTGVHLYMECRCGNRKVLRRGGGHQPVNQRWLNGGPWERSTPMRAPVKPKDARYSASPAPRPPRAPERPRQRR